MKQKLRFAALRRVSTEQQERVGESLRTQTADIEETVADLGGTIVRWYGGQEHATPGHEKKEVARLLLDAAKQPKPFEAVIVAHPDRWSRDNTASRQGLEVFREHGIKFFAGGAEYDLFNPDDEFFLGISAVVGQYHARSQMAKSLRNRIARAKRGVPTGGHLPFGRIYVRSSDRQGGHWEVIPEKKRMIEDVAKRYLAGESLPELAKEYGVNHSNLNKVLTKVSGPKWTITFDSTVLNIHEVVQLEIPLLLPDATIQAILARSESNRTFDRKHLKYPYLFSRMIRCAHCGYAMFGQTNHNERRYYRHAHTERDRPCERPGAKAWIPADDLEDAVMRHLFDAFGNPAAVAKAIADATPNDEQIREAIARRERVTQELKKQKASIQRVIGLVADDAISNEDAVAKLRKLKEREQALISEHTRLDEQLAHVPSTEKVKHASKLIADQFRRYTDVRLQAKKDQANRDFDSMSFEEKRKLCQLVFSGKTAEGHKMGVSIFWDNPKKWHYRIEGQLITVEGRPMTDSQKAAFFEFGSAHLQKPLVTKNALY
ncbi:MAG: recombinase family protein [Verrucomicrobiia bacterium]